jgi:type II secretory pathway component PulK
MRSDRGMAQLIVLWALLLLGTLAMSFSFSMRTEAQAARNGLDAARAYFQARTGISRAIALLSEPVTDNVLAEPLAGRDDDASYEVRIVSEGGKIDVNLVPEELLKAVLRNGGLSPEEAEAAGDSILDWRDEDDMPRGNGAESAEYASLPVPVKPRNGKLASVDELLSVKGVKPDLYQRLLSKVFTVNGLSPLVDVNAAPAEVLRVLPGFTQDAAEAVVARRRETPFRSPSEVAAFLEGQGVSPSAISNLSPSRPASVYTISSAGKAGGKIVRGVECLLEIGGAGTKSGKILRWKDYAAVGEGPGR